MSINPVPAVGPISEPSAGEGQLRVDQAQHDPAVEAVRANNPPDMGTPPKQETSATNETPVAAEFPEDEVQLQQDSEIKSQVIVRYLDKANGQVVLQVPSYQVLAVDRGIYDEFRKQPAPATEGTKPRP
jgi:hypothetical protein